VIDEGGGMGKIVRLVLISALALAALAGTAGYAGATATTTALSRIPDPVQPACVAVQRVRLLKDIDRQKWRTRAGRETAMRAAVAQAKANCAPSPYPVRVEAIQGRDPLHGTLRIDCRYGYELSPADRPGDYVITFGALTPDSIVNVTRTARTANSYELDYTIQLQTPRGGGIYLEGTCVPAATG
jgi:hypothetical protein